MPASPAPATPLLERGWTAEKRVLFLDRLAHHGNARAAASEVGMSAQTAYRLRRRDALFARGWNAALLLARDTGAQVLAERAIDGVVEEVWHRGELMGTRRRYDTRLLLAHLGRLDRLADEDGAGEDAGRFDHLLACVAGEPVPDALKLDDDEPVPLDRETAQSVAGAMAADEAREEWRETEGDPEDELDDERYHAFVSDRAQRSRLARAAVADAWNDWSARAAAAVDSLLGEGEPSAPLPGLPGNPMPRASHGAADFSPGQCNPRNPGPLAAALAAVEAAPVSSAPAESRTR